MQRILILGAGGHAQVVADILLRMRDAGAQVEPVGYLDDNPRLRGEERLGLPILGGVADLPRIPHDALILAIGDNKTRQRLFQQGWQAVGSSPEGLARRIRDDTQVLGGIIRGQRIKAE